MKLLLELTGEPGIILIADTAHDLCDRKTGGFDQNLCPLQTDGQQEIGKALARSLSDHTAEMLGMIGKVRGQRLQGHIFTVVGHVLDHIGYLILGCLLADGHIMGLLIAANQLNEQAVEQGVQLVFLVGCALTFIILFDQLTAQGNERL